jgi:hypothetical protein
MKTLQPKRMSFMSKAAVKKAVIANIGSAQKSCLEKAMDTPRPRAWVHAANHKAEVHPARDKSFPFQSHRWGNR